MPVLDLVVSEPSATANGFELNAPTNFDGYGLGLHSHRVCSLKCQLSGGHKIQGRP